MKPERVLVLSVGLGLLMGACGESEGDLLGSQSPTPTPSPSPSPIQEPCEEQFEDLLEALNSLDARLGVGMVIAEYREAVQDISVEYEVATSDLTDTHRRCISKVAVPAENAYNKYIDALNIWSDCLEKAFEGECETEDIEPELQSRWAAATELITKAEVGLAALP